MSEWWADLRRRRFFRWTAGYAAGAWIVYTGLNEIGGTFDWPPVVGRLVFVALAAGLGAAAIIAWFHGERGEQRVRPAEVGLLALVAVAGFTWGRSVWVDAARAAPTTVSREVVSTLPSNSLGVLPMRNIGGDPAEAYFVDGMTEALMHALSRVPGLKLAARTSSFAFRDRTVPADSVAKTLRVRYLLDGSVQRTSEEIRVSMALVDTEASVEIWSERWVRPIEDVFMIQEEIARATVESLPLGAVLLEADWDLPVERTDLEAWDLYLLARAEWAQRNGPALLRAVDFYERTVEIDPDFAMGWAGLAETYAVITGYTSVPVSSATQRLRTSAERALELDSLVVEARTARGYGLAWQTYAFEAGAAELRRSLEIDPDHAPTLHWYGELLAMLGDSAASTAAFERAIELDPLSGVTFADYGQALQLLGDPEGALRVLDGYLEGDPDYLIAHYWRILPLLTLERWEEATDALTSTGPRIGMEPDRLETAVRGLAGEVSTADALASLDGHGRALPGVARTILSALYILLGDIDSAYDVLLENDPSQGLIYFQAHPLFEAARSHPRYSAVLALAELR